MSDAFDDVRFGSSGIRGPYPDRITPELATRIGRSASHLADDVIIARDARTTGPTLEHALTAGLLDGGCTVTSLGLAPTPALAYATREHDLGIVITASHNPAPDNGFKFWQPDGSALRGRDRDQILQGLQNPPDHGSWDQAGTRTHDRRPLESYLDALLDTHGPLPGQPRILIDPGNGAASHLSPKLMRRAGASVMTLNANPDGTFPARPSEPKPSNLDDLARVTQATDALIGLAHDGDGDRIAAVDEQGRILTGDHLIVLLARSLHAEKIAVPENTSRLVWEALPETTIQTTQVGDTYISEALATEQGDFGGEPSGSMVFPHLSLCPDGLHAALLLAHIAARNDGLAETIDQMPTFHTLRESHACPDIAKPRVMSTLQDKLDTLGETTVLDGVRLDTDDGWALVRPSGTEPKLRVTAEAHIEAEAERLMTLVGGIVDDAVREVEAHA